MKTTMISGAFVRLGLLFRVGLIGALSVSMSWAATGETEAKRNYDLAAGDAAAAFRQFSEVSGKELLYAAELARGVRTAPVRGEYTPLEALNVMLAGTTLEAVKEEQSGALVVKRAGSPNGQGAVAATTSRPSRTTTSEDGTVVLEGVEVTGSRLRQMDIEGPSPVLVFDNNFIVRTGFGTVEEFMRTLPQNFAGSGTGRQSVPNDENPSMGIRQPGQSGLGLRGLGSSSTLVLIDGRRAPLSGIGNRGTATQQGFFDINTIPMGLIDRIEVLTDGASAVYGADAIAGVVNIILKKDYRGTEVRARVAGTWEGGGFERGLTITHGFVSGKLQATVVLDWFKRNPIYGSQRPFSENNDYRDRGGSDFRSNIAYPNTIFALPGQTLAGVFNPNGTPATQAVIPAGQNGTNLTVADFNATAGQEARVSQSRYYSLITPSERRSVRTTWKYDLTERLDLTGEVTFTRNDTGSLANPLFTSAATGLQNQRIPANNPFNPFNQDLGFRMSHDELGPRDLVALTDTWNFQLGGTLDLGREWSLDASLMYRLQDIYLSSPVLNTQALIAALNETDPSRALNVFGDIYGTGGPTNAPGIYEALINQNITESKSGVLSSDLLARGPIWDLPGGPIMMAVGLDWTRQDRLRTTNNPSAVEPARSRNVRDDYAAFTELGVPVVGRENNFTLMRRLDLSLAARYQDVSNSGSSFDPKYGVRWQPFNSLMLRGSYATGYRAPSLSELERPEAENMVNIIDRKRNNQVYPVLRVMGSNPVLAPETSETFNYGAVITVPGVKGLSLGADMYRTDQRNLTTNLTQQVFVDNEDLFQDRIVRNPPSAADIAAGLPGQIATLDARFVNFGQVVTEGFDFNATYAMGETAWGRFTFRASGTYLATYKVAFNPGDPLVDRRGTFGFPQKLKGNTSVFWDRGPWGAAVFVYYLGEVERPNQTLPSFTTVDVNLTYEFQNGIWRGYGRGLRVQGGMGNIANREPPFAFTTFGYDGGFHSAKMRTYNMSMTYSF
jgi:iron complex outermembrane receptor protein